jgi:ParB family chromosome partitioning protein
VVTAYVDLPVDQITPHPGQPRKHFDETALAELAGSLKANGLLEPVIVRPVDGRYVLIAGERRWRAAQIAGLDVVPARVMDIAEVDAFVLSVAENVNRADMTVLEESAAYDQLRRYGKSVPEIAALYGKRTSDIDARLLLLDLDDTAKAMVESGQMGPYLAWHIARLRPGNQRIVAARWARGEFDHETAAAEFASALLNAEDQAGFFDIDEPTLEDRAEHKRRAKAAKSTLDAVERLAGALVELAESDPADLAAALGADVAARGAAVAHVAKLASRAQLVMRKAKAHAEARTLAVVDELSA